ncbi:MAG: hypothetical protein WAP03_22185 [Methylorubrum rhodinum]|uniref:hypothetical protein n=1 Tax=Methylorubrum rhodinum TaxID=29428 RepID=UPI003BB13BCD
MKHVIGGEYRHVEGLGLVCVNPGRTTYCSSWPEDAQQEVGVLRAALKRIADGDDDARDIARKALGED